MSSCETESTSDKTREIFSGFYREDLRNTIEHIEQVLIGNIRGEVTNIEGLERRGAIRNLNK
jgi:hypothetical protein